MNKKMIAIVMVAVLLVSAVFAQGVSEATAIYNAANKKADTASTYVAASHQLTYQDLDADGQVFNEDTQTMAVSLDTADGHYFSIYKTGSDIMKKISPVYDGFTFTPFDNGISSDYVSYTLTGQETVDSVLCNVLEIKYAFDRSLLKYQAHYTESENIIGYDFDDDDFDNTVSAKAYVDAETSDLVKLVLNWEIEGSKIVQTNTYAAFEGVAVPVLIEFDVSDSQINGGIIYRSNYKVIDELSDYMQVSSFKRNRD